MSKYISIGSAINYSCTNGGTITIYVPFDTASHTGISTSGAAYYDDLHINAYDDMTLNLADHNPKASVQHLTGDVIVNFDLTSRVPNGRADIEVKNLKPDSWYRLTFDGVLASTDGGFAHGKSGPSGELVFAGVRIPNA